MGNNANQDNLIHSNCERESKKVNPNELSKNIFVRLRRSHSFKKMSKSSVKVCTPVQSSIQWEEEVESLIKEVNFFFTFFFFIFL